MSDDLSVLAGMLTPDPASGSMPASFDTGTVTSVVDAAHVKVNLGDKEITAFVPMTQSGSAVVGASVRVSAQENTYVLDSVIGGAGAGTVPVGSIVMWMTTTIPAGWLKLDGSTYSSATYPVLFSVLGTTTLPNMADRAPVGTSGTKAITTTGGAATVTLAEAQLPSHDHSMAHTHSMQNHTHGMSHSHNMSHQHYVLGYWGVDDSNFTGNAGRLQASDASNPYDPLTTGSVDGAGNPKENTGLSSISSTAGPDVNTTGSPSAASTGTAGSGSAVTVQNPYLALNYIIKAA